MVALGYYLRVVVAMYMQPPSEPAVEGAETTNGMPATFATAVCAVFVLAMGVLPRWFLERM